MNDPRPNPLLNFFWAGAILCTLGFAAEGRSELITVRFAGTVTNVSVEGSAELRALDFPDIGDPFTGFYKFESKAQDEFERPDAGRFVTSLPFTALGGFVGDLQFGASTSRIGTSHNAYGASATVDVNLPPPFRGHLNTKNVGLYIEKDSLYSDPNTLPLSPPSLDDAVQHSLHLTMTRIPGAGWRVVILASLDSVTVVSEPASVLLSACGLVLLQNLRARRQLKRIS